MSFRFYWKESDSSQVYRQVNYGLNHVIVYKCFVETRTQKSTIYPRGTEYETYVYLYIKSTLRKLFVNDEWKLPDNGHDTVKCPSLLGQDES